VDRQYTLNHVVSGRSTFSLDQPNSLFFFCLLSSYYILVFVLCVLLSFFPPVSSPLVRPPTPLVWPLNNQFLPYSHFEWGTLRLDFWRYPSPSDGFAVVTPLPGFPSSRHPFSRFSTCPTTTHLSSPQFSVPDLPPPPRHSVYW